MNRVKKTLFNKTLDYWTLWINTFSDELGQKYFAQYSALYSVIEDAGLEDEFLGYKREKEASV